jgi:NADH-quinone oxidoreductase subunit K
MMVPQLFYVALAVMLFAIGALGVLTSRNAIKILMCIEIMLNAANITLVSFSVYGNDPTGQVIALFVITLAAAEAGIGLAIFMLLWRNRGTINVYEIADMRW